VWYSTPTLKLLQMTKQDARRRHDFPGLLYGLIRALVLEAKGTSVHSHALKTKTLDEVLDLVIMPIGAI
jgi:hypothetical protein